MPLGQYRPIGPGSGGSGALNINGTPIIGGTNGQVLFNNNGFVGGDSGFTYAAGNGQLTLTGAAAELLFAGMSGDAIINTGSKSLRLTSTSSDGLKIDGSLSGATGYVNFWMIGDQRTYQVGIGNHSETLFGVSNKLFIYNQDAGVMMAVIDQSNNALSVNNRTAISFYSSGGAGLGQNLGTLDTGFYRCFGSAQHVVIANPSNPSASANGGLFISNGIDVPYDPTNYAVGGMFNNTAAGAFEFGTYSGGTGGALPFRFVYNRSLVADYQVSNSGKWTFNVAAIVKNFTVSTLPAGVAGSLAYVTDGDASLAWGATATNSGAGATKYLVWFNGAAWTVLGK